MQLYSVRPLFTGRHLAPKQQNTKTQENSLVFPSQILDRLELSNVKALGFARTQYPQVHFTGRHTKTHEFAENNELERLKSRIRAMPNDLTEQNPYGETPLHLAVENGHVEIVRHILTIPANPNRPSLQRVYLAMVESLGLRRNLELDADSCFDGETPEELAKSLHEDNPADADKKEIYNLFLEQKGLPRIP